jgi:RimJ/RimL family protein N-acetyltransferase
MLVNDETIGLFPFEEADLELYRRWVNQEDFGRLLGRSLPVTQAEHQGWYESMVSDPKSVIFAVRTLPTHEYLGNVWLHNIHWINRNAELRILLGSQGAQGKGYGTRACRLLLQFAFQKLGLQKVYLYVSTVNPRAERAFQKAGFSEEGYLKNEFFTDGDFVDVKRMAALA